jgi:hypothetical protein
MDRKPVWINGRKIFVLPWARVWDVLMALPADDFHAVWRCRAHIVDERGRRVSPDDCVSSGQKITVRRIDREGDGDGDRAGGAATKSA